jgi:hypothetical protein
MHKEAKVVADAQALAEALKAIEIKISAKGRRKIMVQLQILISLML